MRRAYPNLAAFFKDNRSISQEAFAQILGVRQSYVSMLIRGERTPSLPMALRIADIARVPIESLIAESDKVVA